MTSCKTPRCGSTGRWGRSCRRTHAASSASPNGTATLLSTQSEASTASTLLPRGLGSSHLVSLRALVYDSLGAVASASASDAVLPQSDIGALASVSALTARTMARIPSLTSFSRFIPNRATALLVRQSLGVAGTTLMHLNASATGTATLRSQLLRATDYLVSTEPRSRAAVAYTELGSGLHSTAACVSERQEGWVAQGTPRTPLTASGGSARQGGRVTVSNAVKEV